MNENVKIICAVLFGSFLVFGGVLAIQTEQKRAHKYISGLVIKKQWSGKKIQKSSLPLGTTVKLGKPVLVLQIQINKKLYTAKIIKTAWTSLHALEMAIKEGAYIKIRQSVFEKRNRNFQHGRTGYILADQLKVE